MHAYVLHYTSVDLTAVHFHGITGYTAGKSPKLQETLQECGRPELYESSWFYHLQRAGGRCLSFSCQDKTAYLVLTQVTQGKTKANCHIDCLQPLTVVISQHKTHQVSASP